MQEYMNMLGKKGRDRVTGMTGVVSSVAFDLFGCVQVVVVPPLDKDGKLPDGRWFDAKRIEITDHTRVMEPPPYLVMPARSEIGAAEKPLPA